MKKLTVLLAGVVLSLNLVLMSFNITTAEEKDTTNQDGTLSTKAENSFSADELIKYHHLTPDLTQRRAPVKPEMVMGELLLGAGGAIGLGLAGAGLGYKVTYNESEGDFLNFSGLGGAIVGYVIASNLGCALGVYLIGSSGEDRGSFGATLGGSAMGMLLGGGLALAISRGDKSADDSPLPYIAILTASQATGAIIAFNATREKKEEKKTGALLNLNKGKLSLAFPEISIHKNSSSYKFNLFQANF
ncbi:MAG TPA: hypothetical protein VMT04_04980 [Terriglobales bacterium]|nr:hypothetical protein [Terriglobales bacterium]